MLRACAHVCVPDRRPRDSGARRVGGLCDRAGALSRGLSTRAARARAGLQRDDRGGEHGQRSVGRRVHPGGCAVGLDLRDQRAVRVGEHRAQPRAPARRPQRRPARSPERPLQRCRVRARDLRARLDRAARGAVGDAARARHGRRGLRMVHRTPDAARAPDARRRAVPDPGVLARRRDVVRRVCGAGARLRESAVLLSARARSDAARIGAAHDGVAGDARGRVTVCRPAFRPAFARTAGVDRTGLARLGTRALRDARSASKHPSSRHRRCVVRHRLRAVQIAERPRADGQRAARAQLECLGHFGGDAFERSVRRCGAGRDRLCGVRRCRCRRWSRRGHRCRPPAALWVGAGLRSPRCSPASPACRCAPPCHPRDDTRTRAAFRAGSVSCTRCGRGRAVAAPARVRP